MHKYTFNITLLKKTFPANQREKNSFSHWWDSRAKYVYLIHGADLLSNSGDYGKVLGEEAGEDPHHPPPLHLQHVVDSLQVSRRLAAHHRAHNVLS